MAKLPEATAKMEKSVSSLYHACKHASKQSCLHATTYLGQTIVSTAMFELILCLECTAAGGELSTDVFSAGFSRFTKAKPGLRIASEAFCKALFAIFLSPQSIVQDGRKKWTASAIDLVEQ